MVRSTRDLISLVIVTITSAHLVEGSFSKLYGEFPYSTSTLKKCQTCLLEQAGATRLILMKKTIKGTIAQKTVNFEYQTQGPSYFYSNVETYCVGRQYCGILAIGATQPYHEAKEATEAKPEQSYDKRYQCLLRFSLAHSLSCFRTLKELSGSELMGDFLLRSPLYDHDLHLFLLFTSKNLKEMTGHYFPGYACNGHSFVLSSDACDSFVENIFPKSDDDQRLQRSPSPKRAKAEFLQRYGLSMSKEIRENHPEIVRQIEETLGMEYHCFRTTLAAGKSGSCLSYLSDTIGKTTLFMGRSFKDRTGSTNEQNGSQKLYFYYILLPPKSGDQQFRSSGACGAVEYAQSKDECSSLLNQHLFVSPQYAPKAKRFKSLSAKPTSPSTQQPSLCIWIFSVTPQDCLIWLHETLDTSASLTMLSRTTALLHTVDSSVAESVHLPSSCHVLHDIPMSVCTIEEELTRRQHSHRSVDPNPHPFPEADEDSMSTLKQQPAMSSTSKMTAQSSSPSFGSIITVIHLNKDVNALPLNLFNCATCLIIYEEVLLISVELAHVLVTKEDRDVNGFTGCEQVCSFSENSKPEPVSHIEDFRLLHPLSMDDLVSIFCGDIGEKKRRYVDRGNKRKDQINISYVDYHKCLNYLTTHPLDVAIPKEMPTSSDKVTETRTKSKNKRKMSSGDERSK